MHWIATGNMHIRGYTYNSIQCQNSGWCNFMTGSYLWLIVALQIDQSPDLAINVTTLFYLYLVIPLNIVALEQR